MTICKYFQQGRCMFGDKCKFDHTQDNSKIGGFGNQTWSSGSSTQTASKPGVGIGILTVEGMTKDLTSGQEKPLWPLTSYGPGKFQPPLVGGLDESFEELRVRAAEALKSGTTNDYTKYEADKIAAANNIYEDARINVNQAHEQAKRQFSDPDIKSSDTSVFGQPSAFGTTNSSSAFGSGSTTSAFGAPAASTSAFGQPAFGQPAFGQSAFSQPTNPPAATSAFGQPSQPDSSIVKPASGAFGSSGGGAFSAFAGTGASAFGSGSTPPGGGGFSAFASQPSAFGAGATGNNTAAPSSGSVFGQPSSFGSTPTATTSAFGTPTQGTTTSAFGQPSTFGAQQPSLASAFGGSVFSNPNPTGSVFGPGGSASTSTPATNPTGSVFGPGGSASTSVPPSTGSVFGPGGIASTGTFSQSNNSFTSSQPISAFGIPQPQTQSAFNTSTPSAFASQPSASSLPPKPKPGPPDFASARSLYKPDMDKYDSMLPENYLQLLPQAAKAAFECEKFVWGNVPEWLPPKELR